MVWQSLFPLTLPTGILVVIEFSLLIWLIVKSEIFPLPVIKDKRGILLPSLLFIVLPFIAPLAWKYISNIPDSGLSGAKIPASNSFEYDLAKQFLTTIGAAIAIYAAGFLSLLYRKPRLDIGEINQFGENYRLLIYNNGFDTAKNTVGKISIDVNKDRIMNCGSIAQQRQMKKDELYFEIMVIKELLLNDPTESHDDKLKRFQDVVKRGKEYNDLSEVDWMSPYSDAFVSEPDQGEDKAIIRDELLPWSSSGNPTKNNVYPKIIEKIDLLHFDRYPLEEGNYFSGTKWLISVPSEKRDTARIKFWLFEGEEYHGSVIVCAENSEPSERFYFKIRVNPDREQKGSRVLVEEVG